MKRRGFLQQLALGGVVVVGGGIPYGVARLMAPAEGHAANPSTRLRPPGAPLDDDEFIARCIGCGLCGEVCPQDAIQFYSREGGNKVNTPYINPVEKACALSGDCMTACPTDALVVTPREEVRMGIAQIDRTACYPWVDRGVCGACVPICPLGKTGIDFAFANFYRPTVQKGCVGCGMCVEICPHPSLPIKIVSRALSIVNTDAQPHHTVIRSNSTQHGPLGPKQGPGGMVPF
ncbi:MAG: 4Fe-4S dicluster domain-containing protein [Magnetococcales bacterium]|nr:4Fe-4S dicluster domain-containing protein [Magnetococcales bacterium]